MISLGEFTKAFTRGTLLRNTRADDVRTALGFFDKGDKGVLTRDEVGDFIVYVGEGHCAKDLVTIEIICKQVR